MIEMSKTFEEFQLVLKFVLFFTLTQFFSIHEKYKLAKTWGGGGLQLPRSLRACFKCLQFLFLLVETLLTWYSRG